MSQRQNLNCLDRIQKSVQKLDNQGHGHATGVGHTGRVSKDIGIYLKAHNKPAIARRSVPGKTTTTSTGVAHASDVPKAPHSSVAKKTDGDGETLMVKASRRKTQIGIQPGLVLKETDDGKFKTPLPVVKDMAKSSQPSPDRGLMHRSCMVTKGKPKPKIDLKRRAEPLAPAAAEA